jgi:3-hydroxyisobutyrate dehydrogenase-like beta-hydroxyacid dehydrogenase
VHGRSGSGKTAPLTTVGRLDRSTAVGVVSAGAMGSALGARLRAGGARVLVSLEGRSERTRRLASTAELEDTGSLAALLREASVVLSVVPPESSVDLAQALAREASDARPLIVDLNAVSPATVQRVATVLETAALDLVDGAISGPPPKRAGTTRIYLSGPRAAEVAALPLEGVERVVVSGVLGAASAVKMCTASVYKGHVAVLAQALRTAHTHGVVDHVVADLAAAGLADPARTGTALGVASAKAWRYVAEMQEIAATQAAAGLTPDLFDAMATVYADLAERAFAHTPEDVPPELPLADVLDRFSEESR